MLVEVDEGSTTLLKSAGVEEGEYSIKFYNEPDYIFLLLVDGSEGDEKISVTRRENGRYALDMDDDLVRKIKLYEDTEEAHITLFGADAFPELKDGEIKAFIF